MIETCFPGYDLSTTTLGGGKLPQRWGYSFVEIVSRLRNTVIAKTEGKPVTLVAHDWGAFVAYLFVASHPDLVNAVVTLDVGHITPWKLSPWHAIVISAYQFWLVCAFIVSQLVSSIIGDIMVGLFPWFLIGPCPYETKVPRKAREIHSWMCYPYFQIWLGTPLRFLLGKGLPPPLAFPPDIGVPLLYLYGPKKRCLFHTCDFLKRLEAANLLGGKAAGSGWAEVADAGHWLHAQQPEAVEHHISGFLKGLGKKAK